MKKIVSKIIFYFLIACTSYAQQENQPYIKSHMTIPNQSFYVNEVWPFEFSITSYKVQLGPNFEISGLPNHEYLKFSDFFETPEKKVNKNYNFEITRTFQCNAYSSIPGELTIEPTINMYILERSHGLLRGWKEKPHTEKMQPKKIRVLPLPEKRDPTTFSGAVGKFNINTTADITDVTVNSIIKIKTIISGDGYLEKIEAPTITTNENFKIYNPILVDKKKNKIIYEQTIIPLSEKAHTIPAVSFAFFNPDSKEYETVSSKEIKLTFHEEKKNNNNFEVYKPESTTNITVQPTKKTTDTASSKLIPQETKNVSIYIINGVGLLLIIISWMFLSKKRALLTTLLIVLLVIGGTLASKKYIAVNEKYPLYIIMEQTKAHVAPNSRALKTFKLNKGDHVYLKETYGEWSLVFKNNHYGWIETASAQAVGE